MFVRAERAREKALEGSLEEVWMPQPKISIEFEALDSECL